MLSELLHGGTCEFRDVRVPSVCVTLHTIACSTPLGNLDAEELRLQSDITDVLLTFTHAVSKQETGSEETVAANSWSLMLKEVLNSITAAPENIYSSLSLLSELLPLPLPMQTTQVLHTYNWSGLLKQIYTDGLINLNRCLTISGTTQSRVKPIKWLIAFI